MATGVAVAHVIVRDDVQAATATIARFSINGLNDDMALAIATRAEHRIDRLGIPLEVTIDGPWHLPAAFAVDERGTIRSTMGWENMHPNGKLHAHLQAGNSKIYSTPEALFRELSKNPIPAEITAIKSGR